MIDWNRMNQLERPIFFHQNEPRLKKHHEISWGKENNADEITKN